ncbi:helix-turn-helix domain-containing protein [Chroococcus sp. FPU101]|uniref:helix-turn-helix domain-containing protein n=1 Tax=Chroococcus sp. FPU101 TaxID=1974212 RepID=UPI001AA94027|nr:helix-turn-helix domain-containing protein [Chroococcus sp. FPU101]GFE69971.1 hypothetical protein CFPU101_25810 [Chroococcus sp. FPU101]
MLKLSSAQAEQFKSVGAYLRSKRLEKTLSLEDIAAITMIRIPILQALETGNLEQLPELVYVKGFIRRYGEILKIDGNALANSISAISEPEIVETPEEAKTIAVHPVPKKVATSEPAPVAKTTVAASKPVSTAKTSVATSEPAPAVRTSSPVATSSGSKSSFPYLLLGLGALCLAGLGYFFWRPQPTPTTTSQPNLTESQTSPVVAPPPPPIPVQPVAQPSPSPVPSPVASASPSPVTSPSTLSITLKLDDRSWLEIFVDGQLGYRGTLEAGEQKTWTAKKTFNIKAGNAGAVKIAVNDKPSQPLGKLGEVKEVTLTANAQSANGTVNQN